MTYRTLESHLACLIGGACAGVLVMWGVGQNKDLKAEVKASAVVHKATVKSINRSNALEKDLLSHDAKTDAAVAKAKSNLRPGKTPWIMPAPDCGPTAYVIKPGSDHNDEWRNFADAYNSVFEDRVRASAGIPASPGERALQDREAGPQPEVRK